MAQVAKEQRWLPELAPKLPLPIPAPVAQGRPTDTFPRPWSVYRWLEGAPATPDLIDDDQRFAADLAEFLNALYRIDSTAGPAAGAHSFFRGGPLATYDEQTRETISTVEREIDAPAVTAAWGDALAAPWEGPPSWVHGDVAPANLLVIDGRLGAVLDFGCSAVGDPACDVVIAWTFFTGASRRVFQTRLDVDDDAWRRGRGWALWKALLTLARGEDEQEAVRRRVGWRFSSREIVAEVLREDASRAAESRSADGAV